MSYAGLVGLCTSLGITLMSPIGGKLGDIFGRNAVVFVAAAIYSGIYGMCTASGVTADTVQKGVNGVFLTAGLVTVVGVALVIAVVRPMLNKEAQTETASK